MIPKRGVEDVTRRIRGRHEQNVNPTKLESKGGAHALLGLGRVYL